MNPYRELGLVPHYPPVPATPHEAYEVLRGPEGEKRPEETILAWLRRLRWYTRPFPEIDRIVVEQIEAYEAR